MIFFSSNSLIIHQVRKKRKSALWKRFEFPVWMSIYRFWRFKFPVCSLVFVSIEKIYQTLETVRVSLANQIPRCASYFNSLLRVWISGCKTVSWNISSLFFGCFWPSSYSVQNCLQTKAKKTLLCLKLFKEARPSFHLSQHSHQSSRYVHLWFLPKIRAKYLHFFSVTGIIKLKHPINKEAATKRA